MIATALQMAKLHAANRLLEAKSALDGLYSSIVWREGDHRVSRIIDQINELLVEVMPSNERQR